MKIWVTSDLHIGHRNICKFTDRLTKETEIQTHDEWIRNLWNSQVQPGDIVYHLGDFCFKTKYQDVEDIILPLNGTKIFLKGNHDDDKIFKRLQDNGLIRYEQYLEIKIRGTPTCLFHFPILAWHKQGYGSFCLNGHSHGNLKNPQGKCLDVGIDSAYNIYGKHKFFTEEDIVEYMQDRPIAIQDQHKDKANEPTT